MILSYPNPRYVPTSVNIHSSSLPQKASKVDESNYRISRDMLIGTYDNVEVAPGLVLTISDFVAHDDIEMTTTHSDLSLFQISFCMEGQMEWTYKKDGLIYPFCIGAQQSQVRYGVIQECKSKIAKNRRFQSISITVEEGAFGSILFIIRERGALFDMNKSLPAKLYTYTPNVAKILAEIMGCNLPDDLKKIYRHGKVFELLAVYCDEVICRSPRNDFGIRISSNDYAALLKARDIISKNFAHPLTISGVAKTAAINEQLLKEGFKHCFGVTVNEYIVQKRMETAQMLLKKGQYTVHDVAWMVGYSHAGYFINLFRKHYGISPGEMLKTNK
ncbi:helix-turn-helix transcriptional regulator [Lachnoclostridium sp. Marseille-P6806]|uniref:helix-turn-helix transcriptional regulator n=1 Tax=Lachnoclostridium sp. Marseille-P6806 TaxID=2364793 RepID=UPI00103002B3|nr:AraC family transcriptional regulator [Lachnoclostridium sp. Marseille-P6806]